MLSNPISIAIIAVFVLALIGIYVLQRKGTSFGNPKVLLVPLLVPYSELAVQLIAVLPR